MHSSPVHHKLIAKKIYIYIIYVNNNLNKNENFFLDSTCVCLVLVSIIGFLVGVWRRNALPGVSKLLGIILSEVSISPHVLSCCFGLFLSLHVVRHKFGQALLSTSLSQ